MTSAIWRVSGEVIEREELLDGRCQVVLDGVADSTDDPDAGGVAFAVSLVWLLGREGEVPLTEGFVTVAADAGELNASLDAGGVETSDETGAAAVRARFVVDAEGDLAGFPQARRPHEWRQVTCDIPSRGAGNCGSTPPSSGYPE